MTGEKTKEAVRHVKQTSAGRRTVIVYQGRETGKFYADVCASIHSATTRIGPFETMAELMKAAAE